MSLPVTVTISGIDAVSVLRQNLAIARGFTPLREPEMQALRDRCAAVAADGHLELYKTTKKYDADVGREQHGYPTPKELPLKRALSFQDPEKHQGPKLFNWEPLP